MMLLKTKHLKFIKIHILFILLFTCFTANGQKTKVIDKVIAIIGNDIILYSDVEKQYLQFVAQGYEIDTSFKCQIFEDFIFEKLLIHHAVLDSVMVEDSEVEEAMDRRINMLIQQIGSQQKLEEFYGKSTLEIKDEMRELMKDQMLAQRMQETILTDIKVTPSEIQQHFNSFNKDSLPLINAEIEIAQIVIQPKSNNQQINEAKEKLIDIKKKIIEGNSFSTMAILYSEDPGSSKNGGVYNGVKRGQFVKEFEAVVFALQQNEISEPFKTKFGWHIVELLEKRGQEVDLRHILITPKIDEFQLNEAQNTLDSIKSAIEKGAITFEEAVNKYSADKETKFNKGLILNPETNNSKFEINQLDKSLYYSIENLKVGSLSNPLPYITNEGNNAFRIILLKSKSEPHKANLQDDYQKIQEIALQNKQNEELKNWVKKKTKETYINIISQYLYCNFSTNWLNN